MWVEGDGKEFEGVVPSCWVDSKRKTVRWPKRTRSKKEVKLAMEELRQPSDSWQSFTLVKVKHRSGKY